MIFDIEKEVLSMGDIKKKMEKAVRAGDIREKSKSECRRERIQHTESLRAAAADSRSDNPKGSYGIEEERERVSCKAERSGDIGSQSETTEHTLKESEKKHHHKGTENLIPQSMRTKEEQRRIARMGGLASAAARRKKKNLQELLGALLSSPATPEMKEKAAELGINMDEMEEGATLYDALGVAMIEKALAGDGYAFQLIRDSAGDKPTEKSEVTAAIMTEKDLEIMRNLEARIKPEKSADDGQ